MSARTDWEIACDAISAEGCSCDAVDDEPHTCLAGVCERAMKTERARAEAAEKRIKEGTEAWAVYRSGGLSCHPGHELEIATNRETAETLCDGWDPRALLADVRRVLIIDDPEPEATP